ncbi:cyclopropane-fatty-acyl-phospholipid synthase [Stackebrandtia albiflava]|uniref:Cyclopropane-fatty-acyl-phospholipid synthase n=1 Tax=Stackebrandtia albiflava TaxID=406432 RepID=A0A562VAV2_9ACTN|nr:cyclopropane-fatty-acyl-phospholipid synthase family protein [Stackebrandtia albiflava]TWJ14937.1 cyclopropane-fatty-acyl-phospholipid synthase [Stackebrandtia albiflava]
MNLAERLRTLVTRVVGTELPVAFEAWDGSRAGDSGLPTLRITTPTALRRLLWRPGELGAAQAYILGEIDVVGDLAEVFPAVWRAVRYSGGRPRVRPRHVAAALRLALRYGVLGAPPPAPDPQAVMTGRLHSRDRDRAAVGFHYDLSNDFYRLILDPRMVYSCGYWTGGGGGYGLAEAQYDKLELVCRKLGLRRGTRMLDVGCGWGALAMHAAEHHGAEVTAVTLSLQQYEFAVARAEELGLSDRIDFRLSDYRDLAGARYEAISTIEMGEHVGGNGYPAFAARLWSLLEPGGRLLVQQMSRGADAPGGGAFIESYIAPDMHMRPVGQTVDLLERPGLEVREVQSLREHYVTTVRCWLETLEERWREAVSLVGEPTARVWRLYLIGGALAFEEGRMGVDQILAVRPDTDGRSGMPSTPEWTAVGAR